MQTIKTGIAALAALTLAASSAAFASTNGTVGPTSTGTFSAGFNVIAPPVADVQVYGLTDFVQAISPGFSTTYSQYFCVTRSETGPVSLTITAPVFSQGATGFELFSGVTTAGVPIVLPVTVRSIHPSMQTFSNIGNGAPIVFTANPTCTDDTAQAYDIGIGVVVPVNQLTGFVYQNTFTLLVAPQ